MSRSTRTRRVTPSTRSAGLRAILEARRRELAASLRGSIRDVRREGTEPAAGVRDEAESSQVDTQTDLDFALIELKAETLARITTALSHLEAGTYGCCQDCGQDITEARLRALPFAARCRDCEEKRETAVRSLPRPALSLFSFEGGAGHARR